MRQLLTGLLLFLLTLSLHAQYDDLLQNPKISWVAEYTADYELNPRYHDNVGEEFNLLSPIRVVNQPDAYGFFPDTEIEFSLSKRILDDLIRGNFSCFTDSALQNPLTAGAVFRLFHEHADLFSPEDSVLLVKAGLPPEDIKVFRIRQVIYFDEAKKVFHSRVLAFAPLSDVVDSEGNFQYRRPLLWIKTPTLSGKQTKAVRREAGYAVQTFMRNNAPRQEDFSVRKGKLSFLGWVGAEVEKPSHPVFVRDGRDFEPIDAASLKARIFTMDTLTRFNDEGVAVIESVVPKNWISQVEKIRFVQNWYYDERRKILTCEVVAAVPLAAVRDNEGNLRYYRPLFYVKY